MIISCVILDDEPQHIEQLKVLINEVEEIQLDAVFTRAKDLITYLKKKDTDLLFLDIKLNDVTGLDLVRELKDPPNIVFVTSYPEFALKSFELEPINYIVKPVSYLDIIRTVARVRNKIKNKSDREEYIFIKTVSSKLVRLMFKDILYIQASGDFVKFITSSNEYNTNFTLCNIRKYLPPAFIQIHRSYIVNIENIQEVCMNKINIGSHTIPLGRSYKPGFEDMVMKGKVLLKSK